MGDRHDHSAKDWSTKDWVALDWVRGEINETLKLARQALEGHVDNPQDDSRPPVLPELYSSGAWHPDDC